MIPFISGGSQYPTIANSLLWIDYSNSYTDASGLTLATAGQSVQTIRLPSGWGASLGDGLVRQTTSGNRPTWQTLGLQCNASSTVMALPATISLASTFTAYGVFDFQGTFTSNVVGLSGNIGSFGGCLLEWANASDLRAYSDDASTYIGSRAGTNPANKILIRQRRAADNKIYFAGGGLFADTQYGVSSSYTWQLDRVLARGGGVLGFTNTQVRITHIVLVGADTVTAGTDAAIQAALISKVSGLTGI